MHYRMYHRQEYYILCIQNSKTIVVYWLGSCDICDEGDGYLRGSDSQGEPPSGDNAVNDALVIVSCVLSLLVLIEWSVCAILWRYGVSSNTDSTK